MQDKIYKTKEASKILTISMSTFWKLVKNGKINTIKLSEKRLGVLQSSIDSYLESLK